MKNNYLIGFMQGRIVGSENKNFIQFFLSKKWKFITGQNILVDGGRTII